MVVDRDNFTISSNYNVTVATGLDHGNLSATSENNGDLTGLTGTHTITVTAVPDSGYEVVWPEGYTSPVGGNNNKATVEVSGATTITAQFLKPKQPITVTGGTASPNPARPGELVTLTPTVPEGKVLESVSATDANDDPVSVDPDYYTFTMPDTGVTAEFTYRDRNRVKVTIPTVANGKIIVQSGTLTDCYAYEDDVLVFAGSPDSGYKIDTGSWTITEAGGSPVSQTTGETLSVVVGDKNFTVSAAFIPNPEYEVNVTVNNDDAGGVDSINYELAPAGTEIVINYSCELDYDVLADNEITITGGATGVTKDRANRTITFTMPASDVTVNIDFTYTVKQSTQWFYNGYKEQNHPAEKISGWDSVPFYEATYNGQKYAFLQGYDDSVKKSGWGNTLGVYPYYHGLSRANNSYGGYPGQPMVFYKGAYYADIPEKHSGKTIKGITLSNMYWDDIHLLTGEVSRHHQTYDYDDLYKIFVEYPNPEGETRNIICSFKYETKKNNDEPSSLTTPANYNDTNGNGWEVLTNYAGTPVDIYGKELSMTAAQAESSATVQVISQDYRANCAGHYATEWAVYDGSTKKGVIVPSALVLKKENMLSRSGSTPTVTQAKSYMTDTYGSDTAKYASAYVAMDGLRDKPALITYEKSIWGGTDQAERCDARWYWSYTGDEVKANVKVQYSSDLGATF